METAAQHQRWGLQLPDGFYLSILVFADNFWFFGTSIPELQKMTSYWLGLLNSAGWMVPLSELTFCTTDSDEQNWQVRVQYQDFEERRLQGAGHALHF